jgi:hypothetical protein
MSIKFYSIFIFLLLTTSTKIYSRLINIVLDPAEKSTSRIIDTSTEHIITVQLCQQLKKFLEYSDPSLRVMIASDQLTQQHKKASFVNTLSTDLFLNFSCFYKAEGMPLLTFYHYGLNQITDKLCMSYNYLSFIPYEKAYLKVFCFTEKIAQESAYYINTHHKKIITSNPVYSCPLVALKGINVPALIIEMGLQKSNDWQLFIEPCVESIKKMIQHMRICSSK